MCNKGMHSFRGRKTICAKSKEIFVGILEIFVERSETYTNIKKTYAGYNFIFLAGFTAFVGERI